MLLPGARYLLDEHCPGGPSPITIMVSEYIALARDILLPSELAAKVVRALGQGDGSEGEIPLDALRALLSDQHTADLRRQRRRAAGGVRVSPDG